jgi:penicillin amidase
VGTPPFFTGLAAPVSAGSNAWAIGPTRSRTGAPLVAGDPHRPFANPALRYLVHLKAPGWNVIGAAAPWLPGIVIGHNEDVAWAMSASGVDVQDVFVEHLNPSNPHQVEDRGRFADVMVEADAVEVKGRAEPFDYERQFTRHGPIVGLDRSRHLAYTLRWSGTEPGAAPEWGSLAIDQSRSAQDLRRALAGWKMPPADFVFADRHGHIGRQLAALVPRRRGSGTGTVPAAGWSSVVDWEGWTPSGSLAGTDDPPSGFVASANESLARTNRIAETLGMGTLDVEAFKRLQHDVHAWSAAQLVPLLASVRSEHPEVEQARQRLLGWKRQIAVDSKEATVFVAWERALLRMLVARRLPQPVASEFVGHVDSVVPLLVRPSRAWFDGEPARSRDTLLIEALESVVGDPRVKAKGEEWGQAHTISFKHPLGIGRDGERRFAVGPFPAAGYEHTVLANASSGGPSLRVIFDVGDWDRSLATHAPGQSGSPASIHFADLAKLWTRGEYFPLLFSDGAIQANAEATLTLAPR